MREVEREANTRGLSYAQMMATAGALVAETTSRRVLQPLEHRASIVILVGAGNNGGDGLVCANRLLEDAQEPLVRVYLYKSRDNDALLEPLRGNAQIETAAHDTNFEVLRYWLSESDVVVDALLGTGASRPIDGALKSLLDTVRDQRAIREFVVVAVDGPSGMNYDTGALDAAALPADLTVTFHAAKRGHFCYPATGACGELVVAPIGIEAIKLTPQTPSVRLADDALIADWLPVRAPDANKGTNGRVLIVGGCDDYVGAPTLVALSAYRSGAGLVTLNVPPAIKSVVASHCLEATFTQNLNTDGTLSTTRALLVGPGLGQSDDARARLAAVLALARDLPQLSACVLDADALNLLAPFAPMSDVSMILTPHPGEMARLTGKSVAEIQADRIGIAFRYAKEWGAVIVLKGAHTVIAEPSGESVVLPFANPALAVAGTGDVLAGAITGFVAQSLAPFRAAVVGAYMHARAGEMWRSEHGDAGLLASDLLPLLPHARGLTQRR